MKKIYLVLILACLSIDGFATAWRTNANGAVTTLTNWRDVATGTTVPGSFATPGDTWTIQNNMTMAGTSWTIGTAGTYTSGLIFNSGRIRNSAASAITVYGSVTCNGGSYDATALGGSNTMTVYGNFNINGGTFFMANPPDYNYITLALPSSAGTMSISNTGGNTGSFDYTYFYIAGGSVAQLSGNWVTTQSIGEATELDGTLIIPAAYTVNGGEPLTVVAGSTLKVANTGGIDAAVTASGSSFSPGANYVFNGVAAQVTGFLLPSAFVSPGSVTINNTTGVTLSQATTFGANDSVNLANGVFNIGAGLSFNTASGYIQRDNGTFSAAPAFSVTNAVNVVYTSLNYGGTASTSSVTTGVELPTAATGALHDLTINKASATITLAAAPTVNNNLNLVAGTLADAAHLITVNGNITGAATESGTSGIKMVTGGTTISGATIGKLNLSNSGGFSLTGSPTITSTLAFTNGILTTGSSFWITTPGAAGAVTGAGPGNYVSGLLKKNIATFSTVNYEVGDVDYSPMQLTFSSAGTGGTLGVTSTAGLHPLLASSGFSSTFIVNHYWTISNGGATGPATIIPTATYNLVDIIGGSNTFFLTDEYRAGAWIASPLATNNTTSPYTSAPTAGISLANIAGDYIFGNKTPVCTATPVSLDFGSILPGTTSAALTFSLTASYLLPASGSLTVTAPANYNVSLTGVSGWAGSITIPYTGGALTSLPVYVEFIAPLTTGVYSGTVSVTGGTLPSAVNVFVTGISANTCSGTPTAGTATIAPAVGGATTSFTLTESGFTLATGITFQWQSSATGVGGWSNISGATNQVYSFTGIAASTFYRCVVTCTGSGLSALSNVTEATLISCTPTAASWVNGPVSLLFNYTGASQLFTVPAGVSAISVNMEGGTGGSSYFDGSPGGLGGQVTGNLPVTPSQVLQINVGGAGGNGGSSVGGIGGFNGGAAGGFTSIGVYSGGGGGGASDIRFAPYAYTAGQIMMVAAGGGGGGDNSTGQNGGNGGGTSGTAGLIGLGGNPGGGGGPTFGGAAGASYVGYTAGATGTQGNGGIAGTGGAPGSGGGGGGGGWWGGGGASWAGGGGGSSYNDVSITSPTNVAGVNSAGNGFVTIGFTPVTLSTAFGVNAFSITAATGPNLSDAGMAAAASSTTGYLDRTSLAPITLYTGMLFPSSITWGSASSYQEAQVWIDFNNDGIFQTTEEVTGVLGYSATSTTSPLSFNIAIPAGAAIGTHLMRIRGILELSGTYALSTHLDPCLVQYGATNPKYNDGDVADYMINIQNEPPCSGTPVAGTATVTPTSGGGATVFTLSLSGYTIASGITFQWQSSPDGTTWANITGATTVPYSFTGISANTYYRCVVTCSGSSSNTVGVLATYIPTPSCVTTNASWTGETGNAIDGASNFNITGYLGSNLSDAGIQAAVGATTGYAARYGTIPTVNLQQGGTYATSITWGAVHTEQQAQVWIDFNNNGTFETSEEVTAVVGYNTGGTISPTLTNIVIPAGAASGVHLMRMRAEWDAFASTALATHLDPCLVQYLATNPLYFSGTATDYFVNIVPLGCTGTPTAGTTAATATSGCAPLATTLSLTGASSVPGITYQWQSSPDGITWTPISGATAATYAASISVTTQFRCAVTCTTSSLGAISTPITVTVNPTPGVINGVPASVCAGTSFTLTDIVTGGTWTSSNTAVGTIGSSSGTFNALVGIGGSTIVTYTTACGTPTVTITVNPKPGMVGIVSTPVCYSATASHNMSFTYGVSGGGNLYTLTGWSPAAPGLTTVSSFTTLPASSLTLGGGIGAGTPAGVYNGTFTIENSTTGCTNTAAASVTVNSLPAVSYTVAPTTACTGSNVTYATQGGYSLYFWGTAGGTVVAGGGTSDNFVTLNWSTTGTKNISVDVFNANNCDTSIIATTTVSTGPTATVSNNGPLCGVGTVTLTATPAGGVTGYSWTGPNLSSATVQNPTATPTVTSTYSLTVTGATCSPTTVYTTTVTVSNPTATVSNNGPICSVGTVTLTAVPGGGTTGYSWTGPNLISSATATVTATPTITSTYSLTVSAPGCSPATIYTTMVTVTPAPAVSVSNNGPICSSGTVSLTATTTAGTPTGYSWLGPNLSSSIIANPTATPTATATYSLTVSSAGCFPATVYTTTVSVNPMPTASVSNSGPLCGTGTVTLTATPAGGATSFSWTGPGGYTAFVAAPTATPTVTSTYSLTVSSGAASGCSPATVYTTTVTVNNPTATVSNNGPICSVGTVTLTAVPGGGTTGYSWTGPNLISSATATVTATPTITSTYSLTVSAPGCSPATVYTTMVTVTAAPTASASNNGPICNGGTVTLTGTAGVGSPTGYSWTGPGYSSGLQIATATPTITTTYSLTVSSASCFPSTVYTTVVTVNPKPTAAPTNSSPICVGTVTLTATPSGGATIFSWTGPSSYASTAQNPVITPLSTGVYSLTVSSGAASGCSPSTVYTTTVTVNTVAGAAPTGEPICLGGTETLTANPSGTVTLYTWTGPAGYNSSVQNPTFVPGGTGTGTYSLVVGAPGCAPSPTYTVVVTVAAQPSVLGLVSSASNPFCAGGVMTLTATPGVGGAGTAMYTWSGPDITTTTSATPSSPFTTSTVTATGAYSVILAYNGPGCNTTSPVTTGVYSLTAQPAITGLSSSSSNPFCGGASITLTAGETGGAGTPTYTWSGPGITTTTGSSNISPLLPTTTGTATGTYNVSVNFTGTGCNVAGPFASTVYTLTAQPSLTGITSSATNPMCVGGTMTLTATSAGGAGAATYTWNGPDISSTAGSSNTATFTTVGGPATGAYSVTFTTAGSGCNISSPATTAVYTISAAPTLSGLTSTASNPLCAGGTMTLSVTSSGGTGAPVYTWSGPDITTTTSGSSISPSFTTSSVTATGAYSVIVTYPNTGCVAAPAATGVYSLNAQPTITSLTTPLPNPFCTGSVLVLTANGVSGGAGSPVYTWSGPGITATTGTTNISPNFVPTISVGAYSVLLAYSGTGCNSASASTGVYSVTNTPTATTVSGGGVFCGSTTITAGGGTGGTIYFQGTTSGGTSTATLSSSQSVSSTGTYYFRAQGPGGCWGPEGSVTVTINAVPSASPTSNGPICNGGTVNLSAVAGPNTTVFNWLGANLSSNSIANPTATPTVTGTYSLTVSDGSGNPGCTPAVVYTVSVAVNGVPTAAPSNNGYICNGGTVTLSANPITATTFAWSGPGITGSTSAATTTATPSAFSVYTVMVTDGTGHPGCNNTYTTSVSVNPTPSATISNSGYICNGGMVTLNATPAVATNFVWTGAFITGSTTSASTTATPTVSGTYSLTASDGSTQPGCVLKYTTAVTVNAAPAANPSNNGYICNGGTVTLSANPTTATTFAWSGASITGLLSSATTTATPTALSVYSLTVTDGSSQPGCTNHYTTTVSVNPTPVAAPTNNGSVCTNGTVTLVANGSGGATSFTWSGASLGSTAGATTTATPSVIGIAIYSVTASDGSLQPGCAPSTQYTTAVTVTRAPAAAPSNTGYICNGGTVVLHANESGSTSTFAWAGSSIIGPLNVSSTAATPTATSVYTVTVTDGTSQPGCVLSFFTTVSVNPTPAAVPSNNGYICNGGTATLIANGINGATNFTWTGANIVGSAGVATISATPTVTSTYTLTVTDGSSQPGCAPATQFTTTVSVNPMPVASPGNNGYICNGGTVILSANPSGGATSFVWSGAYLVTTSGPNPTATPTTTSTYTVTVSDGSNQPGCAPTTPYMTTVSVNRTPTAAPSNDGPICNGGTVNLSANPAGGATQFTWSGANLSATSGATPTATPTLTATYVVTASDGSTQPGCNPATQYSTTVTVNLAPSLSGASNNSPICATSTLNLTANDPLNVTDYSWSGPVAITNPLTAAASVPNAGTDASGVYTVVVNDGTGSGCSMSYITVATINPLPGIFRVTGGGGYCSADTGVHIGLDGSESGVNYQLYLGSTGVATVSGTGSALDFGLETVLGTYSVLATNAITYCSSNMNGSTVVSINPSPVSTYSLTSTGNDYCFGGAGVIVSLSGSDAGVNYQLFLGSYPVGDDTAGTGSAISFGYETGAGDYLAVATNATTGCQSTLTGFVSIVIDSLPRTYSVTGTGGYCMGGSGIDIGLSGSDAGVTYQLYNSITGSLAIDGGTGSSLDFGFQTAAGTLSVVATNNATNCKSVMAGIPVISINPLPTVYSVSGGGTYCQGTGGMNIYLGASDTGVTYSLYNGSTFVTSAPGTGTGVLDFGPQTAAGTYTVSALRAFTGCSAVMADSAVIVENPAPTIYSVTGGGPYCSSDPGVALGLGGSDTGVTYTLYNLGLSVGTFTATGTSLNFGVFPAGSYSVSAAYNFTGCMSNMSGIRNITVNASPVVYNVTGGGSYCAGTGGEHVYLSLSDTGVKYSLYNDGVLTSTLVGTHASLDFGALITAGTYTVSATDTTSGCGSNMADSAVITVIAPVTPSVSVSTGIGDTSCLGSSVTFTATGVNTGGAPAYSWNVNGTTVSGATSSTYSYIPANGDIVTGVMMSSATCAIPAVVSASDTMTILSNATPGVTISANPGTSICANTIVTFTAVPAFGGAFPTYSWQKDGVTVFAGASYTYTPVDGDNVSVQMTSDYPCLIHDTASSDVVIRAGADIAPVVEIVAIPGRTIHTGETDTLIANVTSGGPVTYQWLVNHIAIAGATNSLYISTFSNNDSVTCDVTSTNGCALSGFNTIYITVYNVGIGSVVSGDANLRLIPNPNKGEFSVSGTLGSVGDDEVAMEITDMLGQVIYKNKATIHGGAIDEKIKLSNTLSNGMYILNLHSGNGNKVFHFVVEQ